MLLSALFLYQIHSKWIKDVNFKNETTDPLEESMGGRCVYNDEAVGMGWEDGIVSMT